jgi:hypothetical protein
VNPDLEAIKHLDFVPSLKCENMNEDCPTLATWEVTLRCCGHVFFICNDCKAWTEYYQSPDKDDQYTTECYVCEQEMFPSEHILKIEPLEKP